MLLNLKEILENARENNIAVGSFNTPNMTTVKAVISAAEELNQPVVIAHAQLHEEMGICTLDEIAPVMLYFADRAKVPVCVHLDHGTDIDYVKRSLALGFNSVMYDGTELGEKMNAVNTSMVVNIAAKYGASVEAEIGSMGTREDGTGVSLADDESIYTDPETARWFVNETGIDALACAFGAVHGFYVKEPKLDFDRLAKIKSLVDIPLVMHGGSGVSDEDYRKVIERGISKVNYYTYVAKAGAEAVSQKEYSQFHDIITDAEKAMRENVKRAIRVFSGLNH